MITLKEKKAKSFESKRIFKTLLKNVWQYFALNDINWLTTSFLPAFSSWPSFIGFLPRFKINTHGILRRGHRSPIGRYESKKEKSGFKMHANATQPKWVNIFICLILSLLYQVISPSQQRRSNKTNTKFSLLAAGNFEITVATMGWTLATFLTIPLNKVALTAAGIVAFIAVAFPKVVESTVAFVGAVKKF